MKRLVLPFLVIALLSAQSTIGDEKDKKEKPWLDLQNCEICKHMGEHMDMMQHVSWETHKVANGMLSASVVPEKYRKRMDGVHKKMEAVVAELEKGETKHLCGFCTSYGELKMAGAKSEEIKTDFGMISLFTSDDPKIVKKIHAHADRTVKEFAAYEKAQAEQSKKPK